MYFDKNENIWMSSTNKNLFVYSPVKDTITPYKYNHLLGKNINKSELLYDFYVDSNNTVYCLFTNLPMIKIDSNGNQTELIKDNNDNYIKVFNIDNRRLVNYVSKSNNSRNSRINKANFVKDKSGKLMFLYDHLDINKTLIRDFKVNLTYMLKFYYSFHFDHYDILTIFPQTFLFKNNTLIKSENQSIRLVLPTNMGFFSLNSTTMQVDFCRNLEGILDANHLVPILENIDPSNALLDRDGDLWVSTLDKGVFRIKLDNIEHMENTKLLKINKITHDFSDNIIYVSNKNSIIKQNVKNASHKTVLKTNFELSNILYDSTTNYLIVSGKKTFILFNNNIYFLKTLKNNIPIEFSSYNLMMSKDKKLYFSELSLINEFNSFDILHHSSREFVNLNRVKTYCINSYKNDIILGTSMGAYLFGNETFSKFSLHSAMDNTRINDIEKYGSKYYFATLGNGLYIWDGSQEVIQLDQTDGLVSDNIESLHISSQGNVYVSTYQGLSIVKTDSCGQQVIENYTTSHGLPSNEVNDVTTLHDKVYVATSKGIAVINDYKKHLSSYPPIIVSTLINNVEKQLNKSSIPYYQNDIKIFFMTIDYNLNGHIQYRYQLNNQPWQYTQATELDLPNLPYGNYNIHFQALNGDNIWSESTSIQFEINKPFWQTLLFRLAILFVVTGLIYYYIRNYLNRFKEKTEIQNEIAKLQRSALQAQMNPHFIFNCLNSLQNFIMQNEKMEAMEYLNRFALLIRQNLNTSNQNLIRLDDEINMLELYLSLEKIRFQHKFDYQFSIEENISPSEVFIPPLLIQPYVENAILHGVSQLSIRGLIEIRIIKNNNALIVTIADNGNGIDHQKLNNSHQSIGMSITQKRLEFINKNANENYTIHIDSSENGTIITINIPIQTSIDYVVDLSR